MLKSAFLFVLLWCFHYLVEDFSIWDSFCAGQPVIHYKTRHLHGQKMLAETELYRWRGDTG